MSGGDDRDDHDELQDRPFGTRPFGARPFGVRPFGARPFGARPFGARLEDERPFGAKPFGAKPFGAKPFGARPFGTKPFGVRPFGVRPFGTRPFGTREGEGYFDPEEWAADVAVLVCERSAVIRLGATVVSDDYEMQIPFVDATDDAPGYVEDGAEKPILESGTKVLRPRDYELAAKVVLPDGIARDIARDPALAEAVKEDLADALALRADQAFLEGNSPQQPVGIAPGLGGSPSGAVGIGVARGILNALRTQDPPPAFRAPGWIVHPESLDALSVENPLAQANQVQDVTADMFPGVFALDGADTGRLLGYPFVVSAAAAVGGAPSLFFSADWREAWIATDGALVNADLSTDAHFQTDETVIRATMSHDFVLRRAAAFAWGPRKDDKGKSS